MTIDHRGVSGPAAVNGATVEVKGTVETGRAGYSGKTEERVDVRVMDRFNGRQNALQEVDETVAQDCECGSERPMRLPTDAFRCHSL